MSENNRSIVEGFSTSALVEFAHAVLVEWPRLKEDFVPLAVHKQSYTNVKKYLIHLIINKYNFTMARAHFDVGSFLYTAWRYDL